MKNQASILTILILAVTSHVLAHPTGNMITVGNSVLWSYINPLNDPDHHACIMIWDKKSEPGIFLQSEYPASDYMLYSNNKSEIYIIERRHIHSTQNFEIRVLKASIQTKPEVIWDWFKDEWRVGEGGFFMLSDNQMVFGKYPEIYSITKGQKPVKYFNFSHPVKRVREVENNQILLLGDSACYLTQQDGTIVNQWTKLIDIDVSDAPLNRNQIFDADYKNGNLLFAYWGKRSFELIRKNGDHQTLLQQSDPLTPHWVAFLGDDKLLFSSRLIFDGSTPKPGLVIFKSQEDIRTVWSKQ